MSDLFQHFDGFGKCSAFIFIPRFILYANIQQVSFVGSCLSIAVISDLQLLYVLFHNPPAFLQV